MQLEDALDRLRTAAALAAARGSLMFHLDLAAELARVALRADDVPTDLLAPLVGDDGYIVHALDRDLAPRIVATVRFDASGGAHVERRARLPDALPDALVEAVARARQRLVAPAHAAIVVPSLADGMLEGYAVRVADMPGPIIAEGHRRVRLAADGRREIDGTPLSGAAKIDAAVPNEMHTYLSLKAGRPILVETRESGLRWRVDGERSIIEAP